MDASIASYIDHAVLHPTQTDEDLCTAAALCAKYEVASICVKPYMVMRTAALLAESPVKVSTVISFPHGGCATLVKATEAGEACRSGAVELDMVVNIGKVLEGDWEYVATDIGAVVEAAEANEAIVKVIFETGLLTSEQQKIELCHISEQMGAAFVKTSTGFGFVKLADGGLKTTGATCEDIALMRKHCSIGVKASGGIRTLSDARAFIDLGATRLGTSSTEALVREEQGEGGRQNRSGDY